MLITELQKDQRREREKERDICREEKGENEWESSKLEEKESGVDRVKG